VLIIALAALDENRWQPWAYQYTLMLAALVLAPGGRAGLSDERSAMRAVGTCGLIIVAIYFWSGLSKVNAAFRLEVLPFLLRPLVGEVPPVLAPVGYAVPAIEMAIGLGLVWRRTRRYAVAGAVLMHVSILLAIGPLGSGWNTVVWPWNLAMIAFVLVVFWRLEATPARRLLPAVRAWPPASRALAAAIALLVVVMPVLNLFGWWGSHLSAELYSGATIGGVVLPSREVSERLPASARRHLASTGNGPVLSLFNWAIDDLNVPAYSARRVFKRVGGELCAGTRSPRAPTLVVRERPDVLTGRRTVTAYRCEDLR